MQRHVMTVVGRYRGRIMGWDVVNEAIADQGGDVLRQTPCLAAVGEDYLERAFEFAREADPCAELYYNDYNIEQSAKRERTLRMLDRLQVGPAGVDGIGIQGHWILDRVPFDEIEEAIGIYSARGLKVMITELDLDVVERKTSGADVSASEAARFDPYREGCPDEVLERQAEQYGRLFEIFLRLGVARVTFWGLHDGRSWLNYWPSQRQNHALLFDRQALPKPAFERVLDVARGAG
jgi:endo-1,4-beta-xylanase